MSKSERRSDAESQERQRARVWLVLARKAYEEPLRQVGAVEAEDSELASVYARSIYDEFAWIEMTVVPRDEMVTVIHS
jgi:1,2-phenylacetyl-CoA epoxidase PaaB subunit